MRPGSGSDCISPLVVRTNEEIRAYYKQEADKRGISISKMTFLILDKVMKNKNVDALLNDKGVDYGPKYTRSSKPRQELAPRGRPPVKNDPAVITRVVQTRLNSSVVIKKRVVVEKPVNTNTNDKRALQRMLHEALLNTGAQPVD